MTKTIIIPEYVLDSLIRHFERIVEYGTPKDNSTKTVEAFRLGRQDIRKLKRIKEKQQ